jgi:hypothetical protein
LGKKVAKIWMREIFLQTHILSTAGDALRLAHLLSKDRMRATTSKQSAPGYLLIEKSCSLPTARKDNVPSQGIFSQIDPQILLRTQQSKLEIVQ